MEGKNDLVITFIIKTYIFSIFPFLKNFIFTFYRKFILFDICQKDYIKIAVIRNDALTLFIFPFPKY